MKSGINFYKAIINIVLFVCFYTVSKGQTTINIGSDVLMHSGGYQISVGSGRFINNGIYTDTTGVFNLLGGVIMSGTGTTTFNNLNINNTGFSRFNSLISVNRTTNIISGDVDGNNNLYVRSDRSVLADMLVSGVLTGNVKGLISRPSISIAPCPSYTTDLSLNISGPVMIYQWQSSTDSTLWTNVAGATNATYSPIVTNDIYYRCHLTTSNSTFNEFTPGISLRLTGVPSAVVVNGDGPHCAQVILEATGGAGGIIYYQGILSGGTSTTFPKDTAFINTSGVYYFRSRSVAGCWGPQDSAAVTINPRVTPGVVYTIDPGTHICQGVRTNFTATPLNGGAAPTYTWLVNGVNTGITDSILSYTPSDRDRVKIILTTSDTCVTTPTAIATANMIVDTNYIPVVDIFALHGFPLTKGGYDTLQVVATGAGPYPTYQWYKNGLAVSGATTDLYISNEFQENDSISCIVIGSGFCSWPSFNSIIINFNTVGIKKALSNSNFGIYPNPNEGKFVIKGTTKGINASTIQLTALNVLGQTIYSKEIQLKEGKVDEDINLGDIPNGNYLLTLAADGERTTFRLVVHK